MPTRKSDVRRSDVSVARFVLADDEDSTMTTEPPAPEAAEPSVSGSTPAAQSQPSDKKDKEKERERDNLTIEDLTLPKSIITRLAKGVLPPNTQIQANAILALTKGATVFINHLANAANELTVSSNKKTIMPADVFKALDDIEYGFMRERLEAEFAKFNQVQTSKRSTYRKKVAAAKKAGASQSGGGPASQSGLTADTSMLSIGDTTINTQDDGTTAAEGADRSLQPQSDGQARAAKKAKIDPTVAAAAGGESSRMEVDEEREVSDAETVPEEEQEEDEEEEEEEDEVEEEDEDEEDEEGDREGDELEERTARDDGDEALDDDSD